MGELLQTRMKVKTAEWANKQLKNQNVSLMNRLISEKEVTDAAVEQGVDIMEVKRTFERKLSETVKEKEDLKK